MVDCQHYTFRVIWSAEDQEFVGLCAEFPSLSYLDQDQIVALKGVTGLVKDLVNTLESEQEQVPIPLSVRSYSGNLEIQITPELHRNLAIAAAEQNVDLNQLISDRLQD